MTKSLARATRSSDGCGAHEVAGLEGVWLVGAALRGRPTTVDPFNSLSYRRSQIEPERLLKIMSRSQQRRLIEPLPDQLYSYRKSAPGQPARQAQSRNACKIQCDRVDV